MSAVKDVDDLVRAIKETGTHDVQSNGPHHKVLDPSGNTVYSLPKTPSDSRWRENAVHDLIRVGVFEKDPKKNGGKTVRKTNLTDPEVQAAKVAAVKARHQKFTEITAGIRARLEPLITKVGGWGVRQGQISAVELGLVAMHWGRDRPDVFRSETAAKTSAQTNMRQKGTASEQACAFWDAFVSAWEAAEDQRRWYFDLVREMKGLPKVETKVIVGGEPVKEPDSQAPNLRRAGKMKTYTLEEPSIRITELKHAELPADFGKLALKAVYLMAAGRDTTDQHEVLEVGEQILALEAKVREE